MTLYGPHFPPFYGPDFYVISLMCAVVARDCGCSKTKRLEKKGTALCIVLVVGGPNLNLIQGNNWDIMKKVSFVQLRIWILHVYFLMPILLKQIYAHRDAINSIAPMSKYDHLTLQTV